MHHETNHGGTQNEAIESLPGTIHKKSRLGSVGKFLLAAGIGMFMYTLVYAGTHFVFTQGDYAMRDIWIGLVGFVVAVVGFVMSVVGDTADSKRSNRH